MPILQWDEFLVDTAKKLAFSCDTRGQYCSNSKAYNFVSTVQIGAHFVRDVKQKTAVKDLLNIWIRDLFGCSMDTNGIITRKAVKWVIRTIIIYIDLTMIHFLVSKIPIEIFVVNSFAIFNFLFIIIILGTQPA